MIITSVAFPTFGWTKREREGKKSDSFHVFINVLFTSAVDFNIDTHNLSHILPHDFLFLGATRRNPIFIDGSLYINVCLETKLRMH
jgi:hypothetical protein